MEKTWAGEIRDCDICQEAICEEFVDGKTQFGPWAIMCPGCAQNFGTGLGIGYGQLYKKVANQFVQVENLRPMPKIYQLLKHPLFILLKKAIGQSIDEKIAPSDMKNSCILRIWSLQDQLHASGYLDSEISAALDVQEE